MVSMFLAHVIWKMFALSPGIENTEGMALHYYIDRLCYQCELCDGYHHGSACQSVMSGLIELP